MNLKKLEEIAYALLPSRGDLRCFHVAAIYCKRKIIALGSNNEKTHPIVYKYNYHRLAKTHAELLACLRGGREEYIGYTMAVLRIDRNNQLNNSRPCMGCFDICKQLGFKRVMFTDENGQWQELDWNLFPIFERNEVELINP